MSLIAFIRITMTMTMALFGSDDGASAQSDDGASAQYALFGIIMTTFGTTCIVSSRSHCIDIWLMINDDVFDWWLVTMYLITW